MLFRSQVVGVNTAIFSPSGGSIGIGFDIPAATAKEVVAQLEAKGVVTRGWIGVQVQPVNAEIADSVGLKVAQGALVSEPQAGGPAGKAGVKSGDVITSVNGQAVQDSRDLARRIGSMAPGTSVRLGIWRNEHEREISLVLGQLPEDRQAQAGDQREVDQGAGASPLGLTLAPASSVPGIGSEGVVVVALEASGPAAERGINAGDVILEVNGEAVSTAADVQKGFAAVERSGKHFALVRVRSGEATRFIALPVAHA